MLFKDFDLSSYTNKHTTIYFPYRDFTYFFLVEILMTSRFVVLVVSSIQHVMGIEDVCICYQCFVSQSSTVYCKSTVMLLVAVGGSIQDSIKTKLVSIWD